MTSVEQADMLEDTQNHEGEVNPEERVPSKVFCLNCGAESEKSKKCKGCRKARFVLHSAV